MRSRTSGPSSQRRCASGRRSSPPRRRPAAGSRACSTRSPSSSTSTPAGSRRGELNRFLGELKRGPPAAVARPQAAEPALRRPGRDAPAALPLHRQRHEPRHARLRLLGRERAARALRAGGRSGHDRLPTPLVNAVVVGGGSWGTGFARLLADRGFDVTLATRQRRRRARRSARPAAIRATSARSTSARSRSRRSPRRRSRRPTSSSSAVPSARFRRGRRAAAGRRADPQPDQGARPGERRAALDARRRPARRGALRPEHGRGDRLPACPARR